MKNYEQMSDFEINSRVASKAYCIEWMSDSHVFVRNDESGEPEVFDPCNNPSDAWPLIVENGISVINETSRVRPMATNDPFLSMQNDEVLGDIEFASIRQHEHPNPLRAAMIVFLMMKESSNG